MSKTHIEHLEDLLVRGNTEIIDYFENTISRILRGDTDFSSLSVKWDGAPGFICASDFNGQTIVATKSFFNKNKLYATTEEDVLDLYGDTPELCKKMQALLKYVANLRIPHNQLWKGDFLFFKEDDVKNTYIDGKPYVIFKQNTLTYGIDAYNPLADRILNSEIGVVFHACYEGENIDNLNYIGTANVNTLVNLPQVFAVDARVPYDVSITLKSFPKLEDLLREVSWNIRDIESFAKRVSNTPELPERLLEFRAFNVRNGNEHLDIDSFIDFINNYYNSIAVTKKKEQTKEKYYELRDYLVSWVNAYYMNMDALFKVQDNLIVLKAIVIKLLDNACVFKTFIEDEYHEYISTSQEGYVYTTYKGEQVKIVNRLEFSRNNAMRSPYNKHK